MRAKKRNRNHGHSLDQLGMPHVLSMLIMHGIARGHLVQDTQLCLVTGGTFRLMSQRFVLLTAGLATEVRQSGSDVRKGDWASYGTTFHELVYAVVSVECAAGYAVLFQALERCADALCNARVQGMQGLPT